MATLISNSSGNFTSAGTWSLVDSTSLLDTESNSSGTTTSFVYSQTFTPGAIIVDGVAIKIASVGISQVGTLTVELFNNTLALSVTSVTINVSDLHNIQSNAGWYFFKFSSSILLLVANAYKIGVKSSTGGQVVVYRNATAGNWSRFLRTTTTQAPAANDILHIMGEHISAGSNNSFTITMDNTATTSFGSTSVPCGIAIGKRGELTFGTAASTNYYLKYKGTFCVVPGGTLNIGTSGTPIPSSSTAILEMDSTANVDTGLLIFSGGTFNCYGASKTTLITKLTANKVATDTILPVSSTAGWVAGDEIVIAPTERVAAQGEKKTILTVDSATQVTLTSGLSFAHQGNVGLLAAHIGNITRNIKIRGISTSLQGYMTFQTGSLVNIQYTEILQLGSNTGSKRGINIQTTTGLFDMRHSSIHDFIVANSQGSLIDQTLNNNINIQDNIYYSVAANHINISVVVTATNIVIDGNLCIMNTGNLPIMNFSDVGGTITNNVCTGGVSGGITLAEANATIGTFTNNICYSNATHGISVGNASPYNLVGSIIGCKSFDNTQYGINIIGTSDLIIDDFESFGNTITNIFLSTQATGKLEINNSLIYGGFPINSPIGMRIDVGVGSLLMNTTNFGASALLPHGTGDIVIQNSGITVNATLNNCKLSSTNEIVNQTNLSINGSIGSSKHDQTNGLHKTFKKTGTISIDTVIFDTSPSQRLTPTNSILKLESGNIRAPVLSGETLTPAIKIRKSVVGDGTAYNGNQARLIVKKNVAAGIISDTVLASTTNAANGAFETISGTTISVTDNAVLTFVVDCDGTNGWVNIDSWTLL